MNGGAWDPETSPSTPGDPPGSRAHSDLGTVAVVIPTYNERENLEEIVGRVRRAAPFVDVLVVDDASPDRTGELAAKMAARDSQIHVLHRGGKRGLGAAYIAGFRWVLARGYDVVVEMDADGSHQPEELPPLLDASRHADVVVGSRWVTEGRVVNWPPMRALLSWGANTYIRFALGIPLRDATGGFRAYRSDTLGNISLDDVQSRGYCFQVDVAVRALRRGSRVVEVPITFVERTRGASKMSSEVVVEALWRVTSWGVRRRLVERSPTWRPPAEAASPNDSPGRQRR